MFMIVDYVHDCGLCKEDDCENSRKCGEYGSSEHLLILLILVFIMNAFFHVCVGVAQLSGFYKKKLNKSILLLQLLLLLLLPTKATLIVIRIVVIIKIIVLMIGMVLLLLFVESHFNLSINYSERHGTEWLLFPLSSEALLVSSMA